MDYINVTEIDAPKAEVAQKLTVKEDVTAQDVIGKTEDESSPEIMVPETSEGIFKFVISDARNKFSRKLSPGYKMNNLVWKLDVRQDRRYYAVFLCCSLEKTSNQTQKVYCEFQLKLVNIDDARKSLTRIGSYTFTVGGESYGYRNFISAADLLNPEKNYIKDGKIVIECYLAYGSVQHVLPESDGTPITPQKNLDSVSRSEKAKHLLDSGIGCDCKFVVSDGKKTCRKQACKYLLAVASPVFESMFFGPWKEERPIVITDIDVDAFCILMYYIHEVTWNFASQAQAISVYYAAKKYLIENLEIKCVSYIWPQNVDNVWLAFDFAVMYEFLDMQKAAQKIIQQSHNEAFKIKAFVEIRQESLLALLEQNDLSIPELDLFEAVLSWARTQCENQDLEKVGENLRFVMGKVVMHIRFLSMTIYEFAKSPCNSGILTSEEVAIIFQRIATRRIDLPLPKLCCLQEKRINVT